MRLEAQLWYIGERVDFDFHQYPGTTIHSSQEAAMDEAIKRLQDKSMVRQGGDLMAVGITDLITPSEEASTYQKWRR